MSNLLPIEMLAQALGLEIADIERACISKLVMQAQEVAPGVWRIPRFTFDLIRQQPAGFVALVKQLRPAPGCCTAFELQHAWKVHTATLYRRIAKLPGTYKVGSGWYIPRVHLDEARAGWSAPPVRHDSLPGGRQS